MEDNKKKDPTKILLIAFIVIIFIASILLLIINNKYTIQYKGKYPYEIEYHGLFILVKKENQIQCIKAPCDPLIDVEFILNNPKYNKLKKELFNNKDTKLLSIKATDLTKDQKKILKDIIKEEIDNKSNEETQIEYIILENKDDSSYKEKGYKIIDEDNKEILIAMGEKNSGGYDITIDNVKQKGKETIIYIEEIKPVNGEIVTMALTYPTIKIKIDKTTKNIKVRNLITDEEYKELK